MSNKSNLIDDFDFDDDFGADDSFVPDKSYGGSSDFGDDFGGDDMGFEPASASPAPASDDDEYRATVSVDTGPSTFTDEGLTGHITVPRISIHAFCERAGTAKTIDAASRDRRLAKVHLEVEDGGLARAIQVYQEQSTPDLLIVESSLPAREMLAQIDALAELCDPNIRVLVIGAMNDVQLYRQLVARGVSEYLVPPFQPTQLIQSISALYVDPERPFMGRSVAVVGAKGGVGSSTIAHNLAWSISENIQINTSLVDLDLSWGTTALDFNQEGNQTIADALGDPDRVDDTVLDRLLTKATERLSLFTAPSSLNSDFDFDEEAYDEVIDRVRRNVPFVVLDMPHIWSDWSRSTMTNADDVVVVCQPDLASLRNGKNIVDFLKNARSNDAPPKVVLNMVGVPKRPEIPVKDFAAAIGVEPSLVLPFEPNLFGQASNNGQMISETDPTSKSSVGIDHLAGLLTGRTVVEQQVSLLKKLIKLGK
ncbi:AAA family ATPase [Ponticaulis sp.]|uniref:AAA family ATPase n=1 Tax=Ponticaulis sp. TaxID=2020902 RepID=UPI000C6B6AED|nr:AAA family ATPase [Ponticaulis sp.]MBN03164.1 pilus assembly protein CpaE [Ponticaulis sp.]